MVQPRSSLALIALASLSGVALVACDTDDGRQMRPPTSEQRAAMPTTTTSVVAGMPLEDTTPPASRPPLTTSTTTTTTEPATTVAESRTAPFSVTGPWIDGGLIPIEHTCDGTETPPVISWTAPPIGTVEIAVTVTDRDADAFVHYAAAGLAPSAGGLGAADVPGIVEGTNDFGLPGWGGPCPPAGTSHTYVWTVYALSEPSGFVAGGSGRDLHAQLIASTAFASASLTGSYARRA